MRAWEQLPPDWVVCGAQPGSPATGTVRCARSTGVCLALLGLEGRGEDLGPCARGMDPGAVAAWCGAVLLGSTAEWDGYRALLCCVPPLGLAAACLRHGALMGCCLCMPWRGSVMTSAVCLAVSGSALPSSVACPSGFADGASPTVFSLFKCL